MSLYHRYNNEDVLLRAVIAGMLDVLNNKIQYKQTWGDNDEETIEVPWYYNQSGDERFNQDFYTFYGHCMPPKPVDGNFDMIPRGSLTYTGSTIDEQRITNRFVQGKYVKDIGGVLEQYVSFLYQIPLQVRFDAELWFDTHLTALKVEQQIREVLFKNVTFYVYYKGMRVGCTAGFPADVIIDKNINYSFESDNRVKLTFNIEVETYQPVFDPTTEQLASNKMKNIGYNIYAKDEKSAGKIVMNTPEDSTTIPKGIPLWMDWTFTEEGGIMPKVSIYWLNSSDNDRNIIERATPNHEFYIWNIPENFTEYREPDIIWDEDPSSIYIQRSPLLKIIPNLSTNEITEDSFQVIENGYFGNVGNDSSINILLEMRDDEGAISTSEEGKVWVNILYNQIDAVNPVTISPDTSIFYPGTVDYKEINLQVANAADTDIFGETSNLKIV